MPTQTRTQTLPISGATCQGCSRTITTAMESISGVESVVVDLSSQQVSVTGNASRSTLQDALVQAGYDADDVNMTPAGTSNPDYSRCQGANMIGAGASDLGLGYGGDGCVILRCVGQ